MNFEKLSFNGKNLGDFQTFWDGSGVFPRAAREVERFSVNGRTGDLTISHDRFQNLPIQFNCFIRTHFRENYEQLTDFLNNQIGYKELRTTEEPNCYRLAMFNSSIEPKTGSFNKSGRFTLEFDCDPRLFLDEGNEEIEVPANSSKVIFNPTYSASFPLLKVRGNGIISNGRTQFSVSNNEDQELIVDLGEGTEAWYETGPQGRIMANDRLSYSWERRNFFTLRGGENTITTSLNIECTVIPRWFRL